MPSVDISTAGESVKVDYLMSAASPEWSESNPCWAYSSPNDWRSKLPQGVPVVPLSTVAGDFYAKLVATTKAQPGRHIIRLPAGRYSFTSFRPIGSSGDPLYAFGFWDPKFAGFDLEAPDKTFIEMAPNSVSQAQLTAMSQMTQASFRQLQMAMFRIDSVYQGNPVPFYLAGGTVEAAPQSLLTSISGDIQGGVYVPQSAPHGGVVIYTSGPIHPDSVHSHMRYRGAGKAMMSQPPFELGNFSSQRNQIVHDNVEFDGRMSPTYDVTRPGKCGPYMTNGGVVQVMNSCHMHDSNVSRFAANDEAPASTVALTTKYYFDRCKFDHITVNQNKQGSINNGNSLGGYTNASCLGFESSNADIVLTDCIVSVDNADTAGQIPCHLQFTSTGANRKGGRCKIDGGTFRHTKFPSLDGYVTFRIQPTTYWWVDGFDTTITVLDNAGKRLIPYEVPKTIAWPPTAAQLAAAGVSKSTHYLIRST